jgi:hypothetical protein
VAAGARRDLLDHVVVAGLRPKNMTGYEVQHVPVAYSLMGQGRLARQRRAVRTAKDPTPGRGRRVRERFKPRIREYARRLARATEEIGEDLGEWHLVGHREVEPSARRADGDPGEAAGRGGHPTVLPHPH